LPIRPWLPLTTDPQVRRAPNGQHAIDFGQFQPARLKSVEVCDDEVDEAVGMRQVAIASQRLHDNSTGQPARRDGVAQRRDQFAPTCQHVYQQLSIVGQFARQLGFVRHDQRQPGVDTYGRTNCIRPRFVGEYSRT
jgi:hypothetical protein